MRPVSSFRPNRLGGGGSVVVFVWLWMVCRAEGFAPPRVVGVPLRRYHGGAALLSAGDGNREDGDPLMNDGSRDDGDGNPLPGESRRRAAAKRVGGRSGRGSSSPRKDSNPPPPPLPSWLVPVAVAALLWAWTVLGGSGGDDGYYYYSYSSTVYETRVYDASSGKVTTERQESGSVRSNLPGLPSNTERADEEQQRAFREAFASPWLRETEELLDGALE